MLKDDKNELLRIGELSRRTGVNTPTLNYWTTLGILKYSDTTEARYRLYPAETIEVVKEIRRLQRVRRRTLDEIRKLLAPQESVK